MTIVTRLGVNVAGQLHGTIGAAVRNTVHAFVVLGVLVAGELVEALNAEAFHLVRRALGGCFGFVHAGEELGKDAAENVLALGVGGVGGGRDGRDGVEG